MSRRDAEMVAALAALETDDDDGPVVAVPPARNPAQVYSVRIPLDRLEQLRAVAAGEGTTPSALIRKWVIERLDRVPTTANVVTIRQPHGGQSDTERLRRIFSHAV